MDLSNGFIGFECISRLKFVLLNSIGRYLPN